MIPLIVGLSIISAILGRAGGMGASDKGWIPKFMRHSWVRDWLCPICALLPLVFIHPSWWFFLVYGATGGLLTTYWDWLFGYDNLWFSGFAVGIVSMPLVMAGFPWWIILARSILIAVLWGANNLLANKNKWPDGLEEYIRYFVFPMTSILLIF